MSRVSTRTPARTRTRLWHDPESCWSSPCAGLLRLRFGSLKHPWRAACFALRSEAGRPTHGTRPVLYDWAFNSVFYSRLIPTLSVVKIPAGNHFFTGGSHSKQYINIHLFQTINDNHKYVNSKSVESWPEKNLPYLELAFILHLHTSTLIYFASWQ